MCVSRSREGGRSPLRFRCVVVSIVISVIISVLRGRVIVDLLYDNSWLKCMTALWGLGDSGRKVCACSGDEGISLENACWQFHVWYCRTNVIIFVCVIGIDISSIQPIQRV